jgi:tetratricopeptide (TPR) repeat protein
VALATLNRDAEAVLANEQALRYQPKDPGTWLHTAVALSRLERYEEALAAYEEVLGLGPDDLEALFRKAEVLGQLGRHEKAVAVWTFSARGLTRRQPCIVNTAVSASGSPPTC